MKKSFSAIFYIFLGLLLLFISCSNSQDTKTGSQPVSDDQKDTAVVKTETPTDSDIKDSAAIAIVETSDYILKLHRAIEFTPASKAYQPFKVDPSTKLVVLDISVRNKLSTPLNFSRILGMTVLKGKGETNLVAPWVVAAYITDHADPNHQKQYDALWSSNFEPKGFHRAIFLGLNPKKEQKEFTLIVPEKPDFNNPVKREVKFSVQ